uniref:Info leucine-rich repeat, immunoglobulin-like and transmembrane domains 3a n=1 Tax=Scleropages formosus TaxID=113540 RepID=A0A8C9SYM7_SCLFO
MLFVLHSLPLIHNPLICFLQLCGTENMVCVHKLTRSPHHRSVLCNDPDMADIPTNIPVDTVKLRVEKTGVRRIPAEAFYYLADLRYLWVTYNAVTTVDPSSFYNLKVLHELRLDGNQLASFPWGALREMPSLRTLDLHNNRLSSVPAEAAPLLVNITYLDLSSNKLTSLPSDLMDIWPPFSGLPRSYNSSHKVVLGLQDNPWYCDCRISKLIELSKMAETLVVLLDQFLACSGPENLAGVLFWKAELDQCIKPTVLTSATKITSPLGSNVLLRCDATGLPTPVLIWTRADGLPVNHTVVQESPGEGIKWSIISLHGILYKDAGEYRCKAKNVAGTAVATITLSVAGEITTPEYPEGVTPKPPMQEGAVSPAQADSALASSAVTTRGPTVPPNATQPMTPTKKRPAIPDGQQRSSARMQQESQDGKPPQDEDSRVSGNDSTSGSQRPVIGSIQVAEENADTVVLVWRAEGTKGSVPLTVVYSPYEDKVKQTLTTEVGKGKVALEGLKPNTKYMACLIVKGGPSRRDQCVTFSTAEPAAEQPQSRLLMVVGGVACALALPLIVLLLCKIAGLCCRTRRDPREAELSKETYVKFETLSLKPRTSTTTQHHELWARRPPHDSERLLLCSRSSIDSQMTYKSESSRSEFLC